MFMRFTTRTAAALALSFFGSALHPAFAQAAPPPVTATPAPAPRSIMLPPVDTDPNGKAVLPNEVQANAAPQIQELEGVTVEGKRDALSKSDQHMRDLINGLPCTGCDTKTKTLKEYRSFSKRAAQFVADQCCIPSRPPEETEANELDRELTQQIITPKNTQP